MTTCPVLLIHLNNMAGEEVQNVERASMLVIELNLMVLLGATSSFTDGGGALVGTRDADTLTQTRTPIRRHTHTPICRHTHAPISHHTTACTHDNPSPRLVSLTVFICCVTPGGGEKPQLFFFSPAS